MMLSVQDLKSRLRAYESREGAPHLPARRMLNSAIRNNMTAIDTNIVAAVWSGMEESGLRGGGGEESSDVTMISSINATIQGLKEKLRSAKERSGDMEYIKTNCNLRTDGGAQLPSVVEKCRKLGASGDDAVNEFMQTYETKKAEIDAEIDALMEQLMEQLARLNDWNEKQQAALRDQQRRMTSDENPGPSSTTEVKIDSQKRQHEETGCTIC